MLSFQIRLGSCHLVNDCWGSNDTSQPFPCAIREPRLSDDCVPTTCDANQTSGGGTSFCSSFSSFLGIETDPETKCAQSNHLHLVTERAERLQRHLRAAIRRLERTIISSGVMPPIQNSSPLKNSPSVDVVSNNVANPSLKCSAGPSSSFPVYSSAFIQEHPSFLKYVLIPLLICTVLFIFLLCSRCLVTGSSSWFRRTGYPFCPHLPGRAVVDFSPNWWVRMLACLQLPSAQDITW